MLKLAILLALASLASKWALGKYPWDYIRAASTRGQAVSKARKLLAVRDGASHSEIIEAHKRLIGMIHPDRGGTNDQVYEANAARDLLLDELPDDK